MSNLHLAVQFFLQIVVILTFCQLVGLLAKRVGQPQVVAEMLGGVLLGPSLLGLFWPDLSIRLFPPDSMKVLFPISQLGLAAYMFVVGMEFRMDIVRRRLHSAVAVSLAGMITPFVLGATLGWIFYHHTKLFPERTSLVEATIFLGASKRRAIPHLDMVLRCIFEMKIVDRHYLWMGTLEGLVQFDGVKFRVFDRANFPQLTNSAITQLHLDRGGRLWVGTVRGFAVRTGANWRIVLLPGAENNRGSHVIRSLTDRPGGGLLATTLGGGLLESLPSAGAAARSDKHGLVAFVDEAVNSCVAQHGFIGQWDGQHWVETGSLAVLIRRNQNILGAQRVGGRQAPTDAVEFNPDPSARTTSTLSALPIKSICVNVPIHGTTLARSF